MDCIRVMAFDPAASEMGCCVLDYYPETDNTVVVATMTIHGRKLLKNYKNLRSEFSDAFCIQSAYYYLILETLLPEYTPTYIVSEGAFHHKFVATMVSLTLVINAIRQAARDWYGRDVNIVAPMETKKLIAKNHMAKKDEIKEAVLKTPNLIFDQTLDHVREMLSEHEYDAIAHGYTFIHKYMKPMLKNTGMTV